MRRAAALLMLMLMLLAAAAPASGREGEGLQPGTLRLSQIRDATDEALVRLVFGPLAAFPHASLRDGVERSGSLHPIRLWFYSRPRSAAAGVCRTDRVIVVFEAVLESRRDDPRMRPVGFDHQPYFIVQNAEEVREPARAPASRAERDESCAALNPERGSVPADSPFQLTNAIELVDSMAAEARAGRLSVPLDCSRERFFEDAPADEAACLQALSRLGSSLIGWVQQCPPRRATEGGCTRVMIGDYWIEFDLTAGQRMARVTVSGIARTADVH